MSTFETVRGLPVDGKLTRRVWDELGADDAAAVLVTYTITPLDVVGPFYPDLSPDYAEQAKMPDLGYRSPDEMFGERFHMDKRFLQGRSTPASTWAWPANRIVVAEVDGGLPIALADRPASTSTRRAARWQAYDADGNLIVAYPATIGSDELPSPSGSWAVRGIAPHPTYTYDPKKNFQQGKNRQQADPAAGPEQPGRRRLHRPDQADLRHPRHARSLQDRQDALPWLRAPHQLERAGARRPGAAPASLSIFIDKPGTEQPAEPDIASVLGLDPPPAAR